MADAALNPANPAIPFAASGPGTAALDSDAALMARVQAGDLDAFEPLVRRYERRLFGYFLNLVDDPAAAADLAQETFVRVYRAAGRYQESGRFESWLFRIAANLVRSRQRRPDQRLPHLSLEEAPAGARELAVRGREARPTRPPGGPRCGMRSRRRCRDFRSCSGKRCCCVTWKGGPTARSRKCWASRRGR